MTAITPASATPAAPPPTFYARLAQFFRDAIARRRAKRLRIRLTTETNEPVVFSWTSPSTEVALTDDDDRSYGALVLKDGLFRPGPLRLATLGSLLTAVSHHPDRVARAYGYATGYCCFCHKALSDPRSLEAGYGPWCANTYGLPWG